MGATTYNLCIHVTRASSVAHVCCCNESRSEQEICDLRLSLVPSERRFPSNCSLKPIDLMVTPGVRHAEEGCVYRCFGSVHVPVIKTMVSWSR